jgi:hypothetical protein
MILVHPHPVQFGIRELGREALPYRDGQVLGGGNLRPKFRDFFVQEAMVHGVEHFAVHGFFELLEIYHETGARIDLTLDRDFEHVVVPVPVRVIALAEQSPVLLRRKLRIVIVVRGGKFSFAGEIEQGVPLLGLSPATACCRHI